MRDKLIAVRVSPEVKNKIKNMAKRKGFPSISAYLYWLIQRALKTLSLVFVFGLLGCATVSFLPATNFQSLSPSQSVEILYEKPQKSYIVLGKIIAESGDVSNETLYKRLKQKAMETGADAVIIENTTPYAQTSGSLFFISSSPVYRLEGLAIKWKE